MASASLGQDPPRRRRPLHEPFSEDRPVPRIEAYFEDLSKPVKQTDDSRAYSTPSWFGTSSARNDVVQSSTRPAQQGGLAGEEEGDEEQHLGAQTKKAREKSRKKDLHRGSSRTVVDPVTLQKFKITNTDASFEDAMDPEKSRGQSVLQRDFPPIEWDSIANETRSEIATHALAAVVPAFILPYLVRFLISLLILSLWWFVVYYHYDKVVQGIFENYKYDAERKRGETTNRKSMAGGMDVNTDKVMGRQKGVGAAGGDETGVQPHRESVEWANQLLASLWPIIDPSLFISLTDMLEDVMQASMPKAINTVRIADLSQGTHPLRIISIRPLDDAETQAAPQHAMDEKNPAANVLDDDNGEGENSTHVNLEVAFAYRALPIKDNKVYSKAKNMHLIIDFGLGMKGVFGKSLPIWVEIRGIVGTMRLRLEMTAKPPFVKHATVSFCGLPKIEIAAIPLIQSALKLNAMNLPLIRTFISNSISTALYEYDTLAMGIVVVTVHAAEVKAADIGGSSDPYVTVSLAKFGKPLFSTRIIMKETQPVWEATAVVLIRPDAFRVKERIALQLYNNKGKMSRHTSALSHLDHAAGKAIPGSIDYSMGFFDKVPPKQRKVPEVEHPEFPENLRNHPEMAPEKPQSLDKDEELVSSMPPDPDYPTGILSIQIHEGYDFEREDIRPSGGGYNNGSAQFKHPPSAESAKREEGDSLPSSYCRLRINDDTVFQTRVKPITSNPFFNTSHEAFVRNFKETTVTIVVRDSKNREQDPLMGMIHLKRTGCWPLRGGVGYGRLRISLLFRGMDVRLPPTLHGFDTATVMIRGALVLTDIESSLSASLCKCKIELRTSHGRSVINEKPKSDGDESVIEFNGGRLALPVKRRFSSPLIIAFTDSLLGVKHKKVAESVVWLMDIPDKSRKRIHIPVYRAKDFSRLEQNYWTPYNFDEESSSSARRHELEYDTSESHHETIQSSQSELEERGLEQIATLSIDLTVEPGLSSAHRSLVKREPRQRVVMEGFDWAIMSGLRHDPVQNQGQSGEESDLDTEHAQSRQQRSEYIEEGDMNEEEDGQSTLNEYLATRRAYNSMADSESSRRPTSGALETTGTSSSNQTGYANSRQSGRKGSMEYTSDEGAGKGWKQKYQEWKSKQRGLMQAKPVRTGTWLKDSVTNGTMKIIDKFDHHARNPDIESEV
ncbi:hypothetical protein QFC21_004468 [Naganishia friedmannii]|uniref:Uncharacterized protein n=1 Tax=Naganishia friedmannii TaxID=89922 RepID=A0ACC2VFE9_9TREE|nr:hypothetical protein QFC21_004468 [Naganishia friedmannii]